MNGQSITRNLLNKIIIDQVEPQLIGLMNDAGEELTQIYLEYV